jgi:hypothetical protein
MRVRKLKLWSWSDYRYPLAFFGGLTALLVCVCMTVGMVGLFTTTSAQNRTIDTFSSDSKCRSGISTNTFVVILRYLDFSLGDAPTPEQRAAIRVALRAEVRAALDAQAASPAVCNSAGTTIPIPIFPPLSPTTIPSPGGNP